MKFSNNGYYIEKYIKCSNCGLLLYSEGVQSKSSPKKIFCSQWCVDWSSAKAQGVEQPNLPFGHEKIHEIG